jgi:hypothetical protein
MEQGSSGETTFKYFSTGALTEEVGSVLTNSALHGADAYAHYHTLAYLRNEQMDQDEREIMSGADRWILTKGGSTRTIGASGWLYEGLNLDNLFMLWMFDNSSPTPEVYKLAPFTAILSRANKPALLVYRAKLPDTPLVTPVTGLMPKERFFPYQPFLNRILKEKVSAEQEPNWRECEEEAKQNAVREAAEVRQIILDLPEKVDLQEAFIAELRAINPNLPLSFS